MTSDGEAVQAVTNALSSRNRLVAQGVSGDIRGLTTHLNHTPAAAVLVDIDSKPTEMLTELESLTTRFDKTKFLVISRELRNEWVIQAMQAGARHFLLKSSIEEELPGVLDRLIPNGWVGRDVRGSLVSVLSAGGGTGATTLAVNLAYELYLASDKPSLLVDMDQCYGAVSSYLGLDGQYGIAEVLADSARLDQDLIKSTAVRYDDGLDVLVSPAAVDPYEPANLNFQHLPRMLNVSRSMYDYCVIDASRIPIDASTVLADASTVTLVVFQLNVMHLKVVKSIIAALVQRGVSPDAIVPVANRYRKRRSMLSLDEAQRALGEIGIGTLSNDYRNAIASVNYGQPLAEHAPRSSLRREIRSLAASVQQAHKNRSRVKEW